MEDLQARTQSELMDIVLILTELTGLPSRWSGRAELVLDAEFKGRKRQKCDIEIDAGLAAKEERWPTLIHESLHSISAGYNANDFRDFRGWEEGVVEQLQRMFRPVVLARLGVVLSENVFDARDEAHSFNDCIAALETLRLLLKEFVSPNTTQISFYLALLGLPIKDHSNSILRIFIALEQPQRSVSLAAYSLANLVLKLRLQ